MRHSGLLAIFVLCTVLLATGCGGGNSTTSVNSVWTGTFVQNGAIGNTGTLQAAFVQNGTNLSGSVVTTSAGGSAISAITGTINGSQMTATLSNAQAAPISGPMAQRTEQIRGFGLPSFYATSAPIDLSKPLVVSIDGTLLSPSEYTVVSSSGYSNRIYLPAAVLATSTVEIQYYPYPASPGAGSTTIFSGTVNGKNIAGTYALSNTSGAPGGTFALTQTVGATTADLVSRGIEWTGTYTIGGVMHTLAITFVPDKASLPFTGWIGPYGSSLPTTAITGTCAVIGNNVTLIFTDGSGTIYLTGVSATNAAGGAVSGSALDRSGATGAFTITQLISHDHDPAIK